MATKEINKKQLFIIILNNNKMKTITKQTVLTYNGIGILNGVSYKVVRIGSINVTLEPLYNEKLIGLPLFREPFNIKLSDLNEAINVGIYSIN